MVSISEVIQLIKHMGGVRAAFARRNDYADVAVASRNSSFAQENTHLLYLGMLSMMCAVAFLIFVVVPARIAHHENIKKNVAPVEIEEEENETTQV